MLKSHGNELGPRFASFDVLFSFFSFWDASVPKRELLMMHDVPSDAAESIRLKV